MPGSITLGAGQTVTCTFTNTRQTGKLEVKKSLSPSNDPGKFNLFIKGSTGASTVASALNVGDTGTTGATTLNTGIYQVSETAGTSTSLSVYTSSISCVNRSDSSAVTSGSGPGPLSVNVLNNSDIVCTITNVRGQGKLTVNKVLVPSTDPARFNPLLLKSTGVPLTLVT